MAVDELIAYTPNISGPRDASGRNRVFHFVLSDTNVHQVDPEIEVRWRVATLYGVKSYNSTTGAVTNNTGSVFVGTLDDRAGVVTPEEIPAGSGLQYNAPQGQSYTLRDLRFRAATAGDGVLIVYS